MMNEPLKKYTFRELLGQEKSIRIPKIQRDYAEGRKAVKVQDIRNNFLGALMQVVVGVKPSLQLDFVYGYRRSEAFEPLDGQQRLTTLFILYWMFKQDGDNLLIDNGNSTFTYATRISSEEFCNELVKKDAKELIGSWNHNESFHDYMVSLDWFKWGWRNDPTIQSMLMVMESILEQLDTLNRSFDEDFSGNLEHITFHLLDLKSFGLEDELYVKMNARGKELSDFDILKSSLEEEIQYQIKGGTSKPEIEAEWRRYMDKEWIDMFWDNAKLTLGSPSEQNIPKVEERFRKLLLRMIAVQFFRKGSGEKMQGYCSSTYQQDLDRIIPLYTLQRAVYNHQKDADESEFVPIDFENIIREMNALIYKSSETDYHQATELFDGSLAFDDSSEEGLLDLYLEDSFTRDRQTCFFAMEAFLSKHPAQEVYDNEELKRDFIDWMRFARNTFMNGNIANLKIDKLIWELQVMTSIEQIIKDYVSEGSSMREFLTHIGEKYTRVEKAILEEERIKNQLRVDEEWCNLLDKAEGNPYLFGQVRFLLSWSHQDGGYDKELFLKYLIYIDRLFPMDGASNYKKQIWLYLALFCIDDFRDKDGCLMKFNKFKFRSWKVCLRTKHEDDSYAPTLKKLIDEWMNHYEADEDALTFLEHFVHDHKAEVTDWRKYILWNEKVLDYIYDDRVILTIKNHHYLAQRATSSGHYKDLFLHYLCLDESISHLNPVEHDSKDKNPFSLDFSKDGTDYNITYNPEEGFYTFSKDAASTQGQDNDILSLLKESGIDVKMS
jgi:hypothetical protein